MRSWYIPTRKLEGEIRPGLGRIARFALCPDSRHLFFTVGVEGPRRHSGREHTTDFWLCDHLGSIRGRLLVHPGSITCIDLSPDGKWLAGADDTNTVRLWNAESGFQLREFVHADKDQRQQYRIRGVEFTPDGKSLVTWTTHWDMWIWDVKSGKEQKRIKEKWSSIDQLLFLPDGTKFISSAAKSGTLEIRDFGTFQMAQFKRKAVDGFISVHHHTGLAVSPDGKLLATAGDEGTVRLWEVATLQEFESIAVKPGWTPPGTGPARSLTFTPDGRVLITACQDNSILLWKWYERPPGRCDGNVIGRSVAAVEPAWVALAENDVVAGQGAVRTLISNPDDAVALIDARLAAIPVPQQKTVARLIERMADGWQAERDRAERALAIYRETVRKELDAAARTSGSAEVRQRCRRLIAAADAPPQGERLRFVRAVQALEVIGSPAALKTLEKLAAGAPTAMETEDARGAMDRLRKRLRAN